MNLHPPHHYTETPGLKMQSLGTKSTKIVEQTPQYDLHITGADGKGYQDLYNPARELEPEFASSAALI